MEFYGIDDCKELDSCGTSARHAGSALGVRLFSDGSFRNLLEKQHHHVASITVTEEAYCTISPQWLEGKMTIMPHAVLRPWMERPK
jgi:hypothetical protein